MNILQVSTADVGGGAERIAFGLFRAYKERGHGSWLAVGTKRSDADGVIEIPRPRSNGWRRSLGTKIASHPNTPRLLSIATNLWMDPRRTIESGLGIEHFGYSGSRQVMTLTPQRPDIVHCHNLHGEYFDLRALATISKSAPTLLTLHDTWMLSGHCAYALGCDRWETGCGACPDLDAHPAVRRDATAFNWRRKRRIFGRSRFSVATPSEWLMRQVERSMMSPALLGAEVIPNGVDLRVFKPGDRDVARRALGVAAASRVLLFVANGVRRSMYKDYDTIRRAIVLLAERGQTDNLVFIGLGDDGPCERIGNAELRFVPYLASPAQVVPYYQSADLYLHAAHADTFPTTILEALACGTPVVATAVGGIPEQVRGLSTASGSRALNVYGPDRATGVLVPAEDAEAMATAVAATLNDESLRRRLSRNAAVDAQQRFDIACQIDRYLGVYDRVVERHHAVAAN